MPCDLFTKVVVTLMDVLISVIVAISILEAIL